MKVETVEPAVDFFDGDPTTRADTLDSLRGFIANRDDAAFGLDFPFGVASDLVDAADWTDFVARFPDSLVVDVDGSEDRPAKQLYDAVKAEKTDPKTAGVQFEREETNRVKAKAYDDALDEVAACYGTYTHVADGVDFDTEPESFGHIYA